MAPVSSRADGARSGSTSHCTRTPLSSAWSSDPTAGIVAEHQLGPQPSSVLETIGDDRTDIRDALRDAEDVEGRQPDLSVVLE